MQNLQSFIISQPHSCPLLGKLWSTQWARPTALIHPQVKAGPMESMRAVAEFPDLMASIQESHANGAHMLYFFTQSPSLHQTTEFYHRESLLHRLRRRLRCLRRYDIQLWRRIVVFLGGSSRTWAQVAAKMPRCHKDHELDEANEFQEMDIGPWLWEVVIESKSHGADLRKGKKSEKEKERWRW